MVCRQVFVKHLVVLLVSGILAQFLHGNVALAAATQSSTSVVLLNLQEAIEVVSWPDASVTISSTAVPGVAVVSGALRFTVKCNSTWGIQIKSDESTGRFREFNVGEASYIADGRSSQSSLQWGITTTGPWTGITGTGVNIATSRPATGEVGSNFDMYLRYLPGFNDVPLVNDHIYRTVLTYTAAVGY